MPQVVDLSGKRERPGAYTGFCWVATGLPFIASGIAYGMGQYVVITQSGVVNCIARSRDALDWDAAIPGAAALQWTDIAYGDGVFAKCAQNGVGNQFGRSVDGGVTWTPVAEPGNPRQWTAIAYCGAQRWVACSQDGGGVGNEQFAYSTDHAQSWQAATEPSIRQWMAIAAHGNTVVAVAQDGGGVGNEQFARSTDKGQNYAPVLEPIIIPWRGIVWGRNRWVGVGGGYSGYSIDDGATFALGIMFVGQHAASITHGNNVFVATTTDIPTLGNLFVSYDGAFWAAPYTIDWWYNAHHKIRYGLDRFVLLSNAQEHCFVS